MIADRKIPLELVRLGKRKAFLRNANIYKLNSSPLSCYFILAGTAKIYIDHKNGKRSILDFAKEGDWIGELSLFCGETDYKENQVLQDIECYEFNIVELSELCRENASISFYFASYISNKLLARSYRMSESLNYAVSKRLASFILEYHQNGTYAMPHTDVSEYLNVSYRHVLHVMKQFCETKILRKEKRKGYVISDLEKLKELIEQ